MLRFFPTWLVDLFDTIQFVAQGVPISLCLTFASLLLALSLALLMTYLLHACQVRWLHYVIQGYITLFTGTPLLMQLFLIYYCAPQLELIHSSPLLWSLFKQPWFCALLALALNSAAYTTELFSGAVKAIPIGQWQSCYALGLSRCQSTKLMLSYALRRAIPAYSNEVILIFKGTALASTITLMDIMGYSDQFFAQSYSMNAFIAAGLIYLIINGMFSTLFKWITTHFLSFENR